MVLIDTSVWIDHFRGANSAAGLWLAEALPGEEELAVCGVIVTEVFQGMSPSRRRTRIQALLDELTYLSMPKETFVLAAELYQRATAEGRPIRNAIDCMIAACAITHDVPLAQKDKDFQTIAEVSDLKLVVF